MSLLPARPSVTNSIALQNAIALLLLSDDRLAKVPVIPEVKLQMEADLGVDILWTMPRSAITVTADGVNYQPVTQDQDAGPVGCGLLVEMPEGKSMAPNVTGPAMEWQVSVVAFEERNTYWLIPSQASQYMNATGIGITAEDLCLIVLDILQLQWVFPYGTLKMGAAAFGPAHDWMAIKEGINAQRASFTAPMGRTQTVRSATAQISFMVGMCTLVCPDGAANVLYTLDGSPPVKANPTAMKYVSPFAVNTGQQVLASSWKTGLVNGPINGAIAP